MSIDWDEVVHNANSLPATMLAECLAEDADEMMEMIVVWRDSTDEIRFKGTGLSDRLKALGLLEAGKLAVWDSLRVEDS